MAQAGPYRLSRTPKLRKARRTHSNGSKEKSSFVKRKLVENLDDAALQYIPPEDLKAFAELPISELTKRGLKKAFFLDMTDIQAKSLPASLKGKDVLGAARTGSGKTLAFLIPVLEVLYRRKWGPQDGLGALIISPTRELAVQIFDVLRSIGGYHSFSAGLVIGGKNLQDERDRLSRMNILVATPGRLLQHMDQTVGFESDNLQVLVLDEADRILDMGFSRTLTALLSHLPKSRQTLLFSATQTKSVSDLARLSLKDPLYISAGEEIITPESLEQHYAVVELDKKLDVLWSFIKTHLQCKTLVFFSCCKQVRFVYETFCKMHPGTSLMHLHGKQKQMTRLSTFTKFTATKHAVLFATDIAARGLDFPAVDWVLQVDCPEDADTYIHRVGRTARYESAGKGLLFLMPSEETGMLEAFKSKGLQVQKIKIKASKTQAIENQLQNLAFQDPEIKYLGQRTFVSYLRSVHLQKNKSIFKVDELPVNKFAASLGLPGAPKIKFLNKKQKDSRKELLVDSDNPSENKGDHNASQSEDDHSNEDDEASDDSHAKVRTKYDKMFARKNQNILSSHYTKLVDHGNPSSSNDIEGAEEPEDEDFFSLKRIDHDLPSTSQLPVHSDLSKRKVRMLKSKKAMAKSGPRGHKLVFDEEGQAHEVYEFKDWQEGTEDGQQFMDKEIGKMKKADIHDKEEAKEKKREKKRKRKERENEERDMTVAQLSEDDGYVSPKFELSGGEGTVRASKKSRTQKKPSQHTTLEEEEDLAVELLRRKC